MRILITGGCGFLGANLALAGLQQGAELLVFDNLSRVGSSQNLGWLQSQGTFGFCHGDTRLANDVERAVKSFRPDVVFHLAGQVAMTTSLSDPRRDFETNVVGGFNLLEAVRHHAPDATVVFSSTNKVYGDLEYLRYDEAQTRYAAPDYPGGFDESLPLDFRSPYGCSKGAVDQYMLDYARMFGLRTVVFRHSSILGMRQFATCDQGWVAWFVRQALETRENPGRPAFTISGNGKQVRDILFSEDLVTCYFEAVACIDRTRGEAYNIGGGIDNSLSLLELFDYLQAELDVLLRYEHLPVRQSDQKVFIADTGKAKRHFQWEPRIRKSQGLRSLIDWEMSRAG
ncbi:MAG: NAD-dependent epimerase/dehydratase family protein [Armatimonadetes bacterium]|nr:NAD-dependent epimerase/dehydratase family protein [Armatimonadota bacterium]